MVKILGIDEAGRGPVIGPLVIAGFMIDESRLDELKKLGVKDSKKHTPKQREILFEKLVRIADDHDIRIIPPEEIDSAIEDPDNNLNWLEAAVSSKIINKLSPDKVFADCPSNNTKAFEAYMRKRLDDKKIGMVVEHKADENYAVASAASILAKVTRDAEIAKLRQKYGDFGSGYPADPKTKEFIEKNHNLPIYRRTWDTWKRVAEKKKQSSLTDF